MDAEYDRIAYDAEQQLNEIRNRHRRDYGQAAIDEYMPCANQSYLFDMPEDQSPYYRQYRNPEQQQSRADKPGKYRLDPEVSARKRRIIEEKVKLKTKIQRTAITSACFLTALVGVGVSAWHLGRRSAQKDLR